jgi:hypothetical protein
MLEYMNEGEKCGRRKDLRASGVPRNGKMIANTTSE